MRWNGSKSVLAVAACGALLVTLLGAGEASPAGDWPQYRGAHRDGIAASDGLASGWSQAGPKVLWRRALGSAFSQLAVRGDAVFTGISDEQQEYLVRLDAATGEERWRVPLGEVFVENFGNGPRSTPTLDGDLVYQLAGRGKLFAVNAGDGRVVWSIDFTERFAAEVPRFGYGGAPLIVGDLLLIEVGGKEKGSLAALDKKTGETKWAVLSGSAGYCSPIVVELGGVSQIVLVRGKTLTALDLAGEVLWTHEVVDATIAMPISFGDGRIFVSTMNDEGCVMLRVRRTDDGYSIEQLWANRDMRNHFNSSIAVGKYIYGFDNATLKCLSAETGEVMWARRGLGKGSVLVAGNRLFALSDHGKLVMVEATPEAYRELGSFQALEGRSWTAPSLAGGRLFLRNLTEAICLDLRG